MNTARFADLSNRLEREKEYTHPTRIHYREKTRDGNGTRDRTQINTLIVSLRSYVTGDVANRETYVPTVKNDINSFKICLPFIL